MHGIKPHDRWQERRGRLGLAGISTMPKRTVTAAADRINEARAVRIQIIPSKY